MERGACAWKSVGVSIAITAPASSPSFICFEFLYFRIPLPLHSPSNPTLFLTFPTLANKELRYMGSRAARYTSHPPSHLRSTSAQPTIPYTTPSHSTLLALTRISSDFLRLADLLPLIFFFCLCYAFVLALSLFRPDLGFLCWSLETNPPRTSFPMPSTVTSAALSIITPKSLGRNTGKHG